MQLFSSYGPFMNIFGSTGGKRLKFFGFIINPKGRLMLSYFDPFFILFHYDVVYILSHIELILTIFGWN